VPRAPWWPGKPEGLTEERARQVVALALEGRALGERQLRYLAWLLSIADDYLDGRVPGEDSAAASDNASLSDPSEVGEGP
jgi:hypothetical protein